MLEIRGATARPFVRIFDTLFNPISRCIATEWKPAQCASSCLLFIKRPAEGLACNGFLFLLRLGWFSAGFAIGGSQSPWVTVPLFVTKEQNFGHDRKRSVGYDVWCNTIYSLTRTNRIRLTRWHEAGFSRTLFASRRHHQRCPQVTDGLGMTAGRSNTTTAELLDQFQDL